MHWDSLLISYKSWTRVSTRVRACACRRVRVKVQAKLLESDGIIQLISSISVPERKQRQKNIVIDFYSGSLSLLLMNNYFKRALR